MALTLWVGASGSAQAQLVGSGAHLPLGPIVSSFSAAPLAYVDNTTTFTGTWSSGAAAAWQGTFIGTGPLPGGSRPAGLSTYDFSGLAGGVLPAGTFFFMSDLDNGSGAEHFTFQAYDASHAIVTTPWLDSPPLAVLGTGSGGGGAPAPADMAGWDWNGLSPFMYTFDGTTVPGNPNVTLSLGSRLDIVYLDVVRDNSASSFSPGAPTPEPGTVALLASGVGLLLCSRRRRSVTVG